MTDEILEWLEKRLVKTSDPETFQKLTKDIKKKIRKQKRSGWMKKWQEIEELCYKDDSFNVHKKVREAVGRYRRRTTGNITDKQGTLSWIHRNKWNLTTLHRGSFQGRPTLSNTGTRKQARRSRNLGKLKLAINEAESGKVPVQRGISGIAQNIVRQLYWYSNTYYTIKHVAP